MHKKKKRGYQTHRLSRIRGSSNAHSQDKQCRAHAVPIYKEHVYYTPVGAGLALSCGECLNLLDSYAADKTFRSTSFSLCPVSHPLTRQEAGWLTLQRYDFFPNQQEKCRAYRESLIHRPFFSIYFLFTFFLFSLLFLFGK
jgi:hypothetical protein